MPKNGLKSLLVEYLEEAVKNNVQLLEVWLNDEVANIAGDSFDGNAYWKLLDQKCDVLDESVMEVEDISFRSPITSE